MAHLNAKYSFKNDINTCYTSPFFVGSLLKYLIVYFMFRGERTVSTRSSVLDAPNPSPLCSFTWQQSWCFPKDSMSCCPVPTHNHKTGTMHPQTLSGPCSQRSSSLQIRGQRRLFSFLLVSLLAFPGTNLSGSGECCSGFSREYLCFPHFVLFLKPL